MNKSVRKIYSYQRNLEGSGNNNIMQLFSDQSNGAISGDVSMTGGGYSWLQHDRYNYSANNSRGDNLPITGAR